ncbi:MAG: GntR family transcriptional regulator [Actinobacteria bacterium]|nr:GntR family transcriptional regulator [Actinomycetota bacterium]
MASGGVVLQARARPGTTAQHAVDELRRALIEGRLAPGERVRQEEIAASLGISVAPVREALAILEQEGQVTYRARRGYFVTELDVADLREIYELRAILEERAARHALPLVDEEAMDRILLAAKDCADAVENEDVAAELEANRRFHLALLDSPSQTHALRLVRLLWDSTETYRAMYYNAADARRAAVDAHDRIVAAVRAADPDLLVKELDRHRGEALTRLEAVLSGSGAE